MNVKFQFFFACDRLLVRSKPYGVYSIREKLCLSDIIRIQNFHLGQVFLSHLATSCDIVTWTLQDEIKSFNIS